MKHFQQFYFKLNIEYEGDNMRFLRLISLTVFVIILSSLSSFAADSLATPVISIDFANDSSKNTHQITSTATNVYEDGKFGQCIRLYGYRLEIQNSEKIDLSNGFTFSMWIKPDNKNAASLISKMNLTNEASVLDFSVKEDYMAMKNIFSFGEKKNIVFYSTRDAKNILSNFIKPLEWFHLSCTYNGKQVKQYINGRLFETYDLPAQLAGIKKTFTASDKKIIIGKDYLGCLDKLKIFNVALKDEDILSLFEESDEKKVGKIELTLNKSTMIVNDKEIPIDPGKDTAPFLKSGRTLLPIRAIAEAIGATINWNGQEKMVDIFYNNKSIQLYLIKGTSKINYKDESAMEVPPQIVNGRTMLPIRYIVENLDLKIDWAPETQKITINYPIALL